MMSLFLWIFGLLLISPSGAIGLDSFPENFVVAKKDDANPVTLTCSKKINETVTWKFEDGVIDFDDSVKQDGQNLNISHIDTPLLGNYSCWTGEEMVSATHLLLEDEEEQELDSQILTCRAKSYDCSFSCIWNSSSYTAVRLGLGHDCSEGEKSCHWVSSTDGLKDGIFHFQMSHSLLPHAEENTKLELTIEAIFMYSILRRTKRFYLREIIQPDRPQTVTCQEVEQGLNVTIDPPPSWSTPQSFFRLDHEIEYVLRDDGKIGHSSSSLIPKRISKLRVHSRDSLVCSSWSQWTDWKNVIYTNSGIVCS